MKHAFLITAYNEPEILKHELKMLDHAKVDIFIHIDKKADLSAFDFYKIFVRNLTCTWLTKILMFIGEAILK